MNNHRIVIQPLDESAALILYENGSFHSCWGVFRELSKILEPIDENPALVRKLAAEPDVFERDIPVYTQIDGKLVKKYCEVVGWPNSTHDGVVMRDGEFSTDREFILTIMKNNINEKLKIVRNEIERKMQEVDRLEEKLAALLASSPDDDEAEPTQPLAM